MTSCHAFPGGRTDDLARIRDALPAAAEAVRPFTPGDLAVVSKAERGDPLTGADVAANRALRDFLSRDGEVWLSEESLDNAIRFSRERVWVVDPIDGTPEFVAGDQRRSIPQGGTRFPHGSAHPSGHTTLPNYIAAGPRIWRSVVSNRIGETA